MRLVLSGCLVLMTACSKPPPFAVLITTVDEQGHPLAAVPVRIGAQQLSSDADGHAQALILGEEGTRIPLTLSAPEGYRLTGGNDGIVLRRIYAPGGGGSLLPVERTVRFESLLRNYAVLIDGGVAGLPVQTYGNRRAVTNKLGIAGFLYQGMPGDELRVELDTSGTRLRPANPSTTFVLPEHADAFVWHEQFERPAPQQKKKAPPRERPRIRAL